MTFEELVARALDELPEEFAAHLSNVEVVCQDEPSAEQAPGDIELFGLYEGVPQTERGEYTFALPDKITIFQRPLERAFPNRDDLVDQVRITVVHEIAHHFGISDQRLTELGWD